MRFSASDSVIDKYGDAICSDEAFPRRSTKGKENEGYFDRSFLHHDKVSR